MNIDAITPKDSVIEKPLIGPEPNANSKTAAIKVVIFASRTVILAFEYPESKACIEDFSVFNSSLILSNIKTFASTAIPTVKIIPAIPGKVKVASKIVNIPTNIKRFNIKAMFVMIPKILYLKKNVLH